ncbi:sugar kinase [Terribacillus saccharophilus]|uniref:2-dehydro-3-deoxygluconokinase n=1 Tax=Terribacillus saccharophilus TaxID=361277 RepID=A0ABX4GVY7_9BACI|nr:sugar kinase [Terribacillus saccharophilus]PAD34705.1 2-dehydro-3-deoxygluconokinase [Terribacillus saccharophilus]PAD95453.1 2-dehydro-3-deoxygluconokinase [Terribacillus saccharophilus]PAD99031.1 2-dehydro-3-deoxygluconokinase [Terribacillus saccharophilus]
MSRILTIGEPMALFVAEQEGLLDDAERFSRFIAGAEVNFSIGMSRLGHQVTYVTQLGLDPFGRNIHKFLRKNKIDTTYVSYEPAFVTGMQWKQKVKSGDPEVFSARKNSAASHMDKKLIKKIKWADYDHLHLTGIPPALSESCRELVYQMMKEAKENGLQVSFDPNLRPGLWPDKQEMALVINELASQADIIFPGIAEGRQLTGKTDVLDIAAYYHEAGVPTVVLKLGAEGAFTSCMDGTQFYTEGFPVKKVVDTVGAGDGFAVGVVSGLLEGLEMPDSIARGAAIGALAVMSPGDNDGLPNREELTHFMKREPIG